MSGYFWNPLLLQNGEGQEKNKARGVDYSVNSPVIRYESRVSLDILEQIK